MILPRRSSWPPPHRPSNCLPELTPNPSTRDVEPEPAESGTVPYQRGIVRLFLCPARSVGRSVQRHAGARHWALASTHVSTALALRARKSTPRTHIRTPRRTGREVPQKYGCALSVRILFIPLALSRGGLASFLEQLVTLCDGLCVVCVLRRGAAGIIIFD
jgi:hypothetical protein